jgi:aspartyl-tRNA(Asn)/glutamyl-tRNA(Gln) amidotransferase subunit A
LSAPLWSWSLKSVRDAIARRELSPVAVVESILERIASRSRINAYITVLGEHALAEAYRRQEELVHNPTVGSLHGVPIALKDNIATAGQVTTAGSPLREQWVPSEDADVVQALRRSGAVVIGKNNLYEFAFGAAHPKFGETLNPWNFELSCGGSSNGSGAAVADGQAYGAIGTDTGGSIRIPAAMCGIVGLKPTYGHISNRGVVPVSTDLDVVGPMTRSVEDAALLLSGMGIPADASIDSNSPTMRTLKIGVWAPRSADRVVPQVIKALEVACKRLEEHGFEIREVAIPDLALTLDVMWTIASADAAEYHRPDMQTRLDAYCDDVRENLLVGAMIPAVDYIRAGRLRRRIIHQTAAIFRLVDILLLPSIPITPFRTGQKRIRLGATEAGVLPVVMTYTPLANLTGQPAIVVPVMTQSDAPPTTVQLYGRHADEGTLLRAAKVVERSAVTLPGERA